MDFIFGTLATDELRQLHHKIARQGVQHSHQMSPLDPKPDEAVTITVYVGQDVTAHQVACYYTTDGSVPAGSRGTVSNGSAFALNKIDTIWDTIAWGYVDVWQGIIPAQTEGTTVRYQISAWSTETEAFADYPALKATTERAASAFFQGKTLPDLPPIGTTQPNTFTYTVDTYTAPTWAKGAIIYHIFVDRFYPGDDKAWLEPEALSGFFGGTLQGIVDKLDYITELGANCIWLSPTFPSPTHHGYDITDYEHVEPRMGGDDALRALIHAAHARGIRIILDLVCNHCSNEHPYFVDAKQQEASPYRDWFIFDDSPIGYETFFGVETMPMINLKNPATRDWMIGIAQYWLREFDVDGFRLDHANGPGADFWADFRKGCRTVKPDVFIFGEVVEAPTLLKSYVGRLDGLLDFTAEDLLRKCYGYESITEAEFENFIQRHYSFFPSDFVMPTFLDNHDMDRFLYIAGDDKSKLMKAAARQFKLPNPPIIYYGTEVGLSQKIGKKDLEQSRLPMPWENQDQELFKFYQELIQARKR